MLSFPAFFFICIIKPTLSSTCTMYPVVSFSSTTWRVAVRRITSYKHCVVLLRAHWEIAQVTFRVSSGCLCNHFLHENLFSHIHTRNQNHQIMSIYHEAYIAGVGSTVSNCLVQQIRKEIYLLNMNNYWTGISCMASNCCPAMDLVYRFYVFYAHPAEDAVTIHKYLNVLIVSWGN